MNDENQQTPPQPGPVPVPPQPQPEVVPQQQSQPPTSQPPVMQQQPVMQAPPTHSFSKKKLTVAIVAIVLLVAAAFGIGLVVSDGDDSVSTPSQADVAVINDRFSDAQSKGRDTVRKSDINSMYQKLEEYYNENGSYPNVGFSAALFPGIDSGAFTDPDDNFIVISVTGSQDAPPAPYTVSDKPEGAQYTYAAYQCTESSCQRYTIYAWLENGTTLYSKQSLN